MLMLKSLRKRNGWTQKHVADMLGISQNNYSYIENEKIKISDEYIAKLCDIYQCSVDYLLGETDFIKDSIINRAKKEIEMIDFILTGEERFDYYEELSEGDKKNFIVLLLYDEKTLRILRKGYMAHIKRADELTWFVDGALVSEYKKQKENDKQ